jgi:biotin synthase-related radical SAM superfamily protein
MGWAELKAEALTSGGCRIEGPLPPDAIATSTAGPGAGGPGSVFFSSKGRRLRLGINPDGPALLVSKADGTARLELHGARFEGRIESVGLHCPRQAFITVSESCIFECRYCPVPRLRGPRKTIDECKALVASVCDRVDAIALTSGVAVSIPEEEAYVCSVIEALRCFDLPIGVSIYPAPGTARRLHDLGVSEVKFNLEAAAPMLFETHCPGLSYETVIEALEESVPLFGPGHVFSNVIIGLGETDRELEACIDRLVRRGVVPVLRPLNPVAACRGCARPDPARLIRMADYLKKRLEESRLDASKACSMCGACTGCDLSAWRDL